MTNKVIIIDSSTLFNLANSQINDLLSPGLDVLDLPGTGYQYVIRPEVYFEAITRNKNPVQLSAIQSWITRNDNLILDSHLLTTFNPSMVTTFDQLGDNVIFGHLTRAAHAGITKSR